MKESLKYFAKLSSTAAFSWLKINILGAISTIVVFILALIFIGKDIDAGHSGHVSAIPFVGLMFVAKPLSSILLVLIIISSGFIFVLGNKYIIGKLIHKILKDKSEGHIEPFIDKILSKLQEKQPDLIRKGADAAMIKLKLMNQVKTESDNKWMKRIITFGLQKISLDDIDFSSDTISFSEIIKEKLVTALYDISEPSRNSILIVIGLQWFFLLVIFFSPI